MAGRTVCAVRSAAQRVRAVRTGVNQRRVDRRTGASRRTECACGLAPRAVLSSGANGRELGLLQTGVPGGTGRAIGRPCPGVGASGTRQDQIRRWTEASRGTHSAVGLTSDRVQPRGTLVRSQSTRTVPARLALGAGGGSSHCVVALGAFYRRDRANGTGITHGARAA